MGTGAPRDLSSPLAQAVGLKYVANEIQRLTLINKSTIGRQPWQVLTHAPTIHLIYLSQCMLHTQTHTQISEVSPAQAYSVTLLGVRWPA